MSDLFSSLLIFTIIKTILSTFFTASKFYKNLVKWALTEMECSVAGTTTLDREWKRRSQRVNLTLIRSRNMLLYNYTPAPRRGRGYTVLPLSVCPSFRPSFHPSVLPSVQDIFCRTFLSNCFGPIRFLLPVCRLC